MNNWYDYIMAPVLLKTHIRISDEQYQRLSKLFGVALFEPDIKTKLLSGDKELLSSYEISPELQDWIATLPVTSLHELASYIYESIAPASHDVR